MWLTLDHILNKFVKLGQKFGNANKLLYIKIMIKIKINRKISEATKIN